MTESTKRKMLDSAGKIAQLVAGCEQVRRLARKEGNERLVRRMEDIREELVTELRPRATAVTLPELGPFTTDERAPSTD